MKEEYSIIYTDEEAEEASYNLINFFNLLYEISREKKICTEDTNLPEGTVRDIDGNSITL